MSVWRHGFLLEIFQAKTTNSPTQSEDKADLFK